MGERGTLEAVAHHLALALEPLRFAATDYGEFRALMLRLGWDVESLPAGWGTVATAVGDLLALLESLEEEPELDDVMALLGKVNAVRDAIDGISGAPVGSDPGTFNEEIARRLLELLVIDYLSTVAPTAFASLRALGVIEAEPHDETPTRPAYVETRFDFEEVPAILAEPKALPKRLYGWGTEDFHAEPLLAALRELALSLRFPAYMRIAERELAEGYKEPVEEDATTVGWMLVVPVYIDSIGGQPIELGLALLEMPAEGPKPPGLILQPLLPSEAAVSRQLAPGLSLEVRGATDLAETLGIVVRPTEMEVRSPFQPDGQIPSAGLGLALRYTRAEPRVLLGTPGATRLEVVGGAAEFGVDVHAGEFDLRLGLAVEGLAAVVSAGEQDSFLGQMLGAKDVRVPIPLEIGWSRRTGLVFGGSAGFEVAVSPHLELGPIRLEEVELAVRATATQAQAPRLTTEAGIALAGKLGPFGFTVQGIGVRLGFLFEQGNAGPFDIEVGFKPPRGMGLSVDAVAVKGGGYLYFDYERGEYAGVLELALKDQIQVKAIGLLNTKLPGGQKGFSLILIITAQFPPIQLSFGFVLTGVGGLIGVNRTMVVEVLRAGIRNRTLDSILFPENPVQNATKIISDLKSVFPPAERRFVLGPMIELGWGTPPLVKGRLGVLIELPDPVRIALLGQLKLLLPSEVAPVARINLDALGLIELERSAASLDATIYDSEIATFPLTGDMAMRMTWAGRPNFALALGGLNPRFKPPPGFPELRRLTLEISKGPNPRLTLQAYLAATSNTVQFGARAQLHATAKGFTVRGEAGFDALFVLSPFSVLADLSVQVEVLRGSKQLMVVRLDMTLTGPRPWRARGEASFKALGITVTVAFDVRVGPAGQITLPQANAKDPLLEALKDARNWSASLPPEAERGATLGPGKLPEETVLVHPFGRLGVRQTVVPLNQRIQRFGSATVAGPKLFRITGAALNGTAVTPTATKEWFAPAQFLELSDAEKLSRSSYEAMEAGVALGKAGGIAHGAKQSLDLDYETLIVESPVEPAASLGLYQPNGEVFLALAGQGAAAMSPVHLSGDRKYVEPATTSPIANLDEGHVIASVDDLAPRSDLLPASGASLYEAEAALADHLAAHPAEAGSLDVIPAHEAVPA